MSLDELRRRKAQEYQSKALLRQTPQMLRETAAMNNAQIPGMNQQLANDLQPRQGDLVITIPLQFPLNLSSSLRITDSKGLMVIRDQINRILASRQNGHT